MKLSKLVGWVLTLVPFVVVAGAMVVVYGFLTPAIMAGVAVMVWMLMKGLELIHK